MAKQTFTTGQVLTAAQVNALQTNDFNQTVDTKTASYVLVVGDRGNRIEFNTSGSVTCTVNTGIFSAGDTVMIQNRGAGVVTITAGTATVNTAGSLALAQWEGGVLYFISASAAVWFEYATPQTGDITAVTTGANSGLTGGATSGAVDLRLNTTAKGSLLVGSGASTIGELTVGTNGHTLVADSSTATGLKWAAPGGGGANWTLLNSGGTSLSGSATTTISGISGQDKIMVIVADAGTNATTALVTVRLNGITTGNKYFVYGGFHQAQSTYQSSAIVAPTGAQGWTNYVPLGQLSSGNSWVDGGVTFTGCNSTGVIQFISAGSGRDGGSPDHRAIYAQGWVDTTGSAVTSVSVFSTNGNFDAGTVYVYASA